MSIDSSAGYYQRNKKWLQKIFVKGIKIFLKKKSKNQEYRHKTRYFFFKIKFLFFHQMIPLQKL